MHETFEEKELIVINLEFVHMCTWQLMLVCYTILKQESKFAILQA
jgi:hypothetical protein